ncbi:MAG: PAS domain-containing protein, partial [Deltaproteobacteria bacterium]|nr:PAS domain-containing protein [Deltaproteobacteria bacterium]
MNVNDASRQSPPLAPPDKAALPSIADLQIGIVISGPTGELRHSNQAASDLLALSESELRGEVSADPARTVVHEDGSEFSVETQPVAVALATGRPVHNIVMGIYHPARQQRVWLLVNVDLAWDESGAVSQVIATYSDISDRRGFEAR